MLFWYKVWEWLKHYWMYVLLVVGAAVLLIISAGKRNEFAKIFEKMVESNKDLRDRISEKEVEIGNKKEKVIKDAKRKIDKVDGDEKKRLDKISSDYEKKRKKIIEDTKRRYEKFKDNPDEVSEEAGKWLDDFLYDDSDPT